MARSRQQKMFVSRKCAVMIFITVGTQEPFDRLIKAVDEIIPELEDQEIIVQAPLKGYKPLHFETLNFINPLQFKKIFDRADFIISHAGMGTILSAMSNQKTLLIMPRLVKYGEHRNDHQVATALKFKSLKYINVAENEVELQNILKNRKHNDLNASKTLGDYASDELIQSISCFLTK